MSIAGGKHLAFERGKSIGCETIQLFIRNARSWVSKPLDKKDIIEFKKNKEKYNDIWPLVSHNSYLINLANQDKELEQKSYQGMLDELIKADQLGIDYVNMHPGNKNKDENDIKALLRISEQLIKLMNETKSSNVVILLETTAGQGNDLGYKFEHMISIIDELNDKKRIGITFDTCHSYVAGYDFTTLNKYNEMWDLFNEIINIKYLKAFHLNDAEGELNSKKDRHTHIGQGKIGKNPFRYFLNDKRFKNIPGILETPKGKDLKEDIINLNTLKSLINKLSS